MKGRDVESLDYWRLCDEYDIQQAAWLVVGLNPSEMGIAAEESSIYDPPSGYDAVETAISTALRRGIIKGKLVPLIHKNEDGTSNSIEDSIDIYKSSVEVESLRIWLSDRGIKSRFFFPMAIDEPDFLNQANPRYAPKLAAAFGAWREVHDTGGKSAKQALMKWLREHASEYGLCDEDGNPNELGIEECAKVANWEMGGGAPKTPGK